MKQVIFASYRDWLTEQEMPKGKRAVIQSALELFSRNGYDGTATIEIAKHAGVSQATIFKYFKTKQDLLESILMPIVSDLLPNYREDFLATIPTTKTIQQTVHFLVQNRFQFLEDNTDVMLIFFSQMMTNPQMKAKMMQFIKETEPQFVTRIYGALKQTGELREELTPLAVFRTFGGQLIAYFLQRTKILPEQPTDEEDDLRLIEDIIVAALSK
ncbi:TetR/AcrR family transcriptional regulator [Secundilactobacillus similis]|uniref:TetR family transcriptional regulator n=1 Tax=Secundilactobacillus similis DSM 23365 = JCM 2765 TaxID=1423804 RepID=A0A0R2FE44_9LACO|nr:TetR/AcrR family transcriptional regulator [Secundilactobacillus similis]KRN26825.1 TetR family transcriptional regulator [Secundilactobacillus similis DSM 23365 = JCM 2765]